MAQESIVRNRSSAVIAPLGAARTRRGRKRASQMYYPVVLSALALFAAFTQVAPAEALAGGLRAAIWNDLQRNAMIGNGNWIASLWYNAGSTAPEAADLHIQSLICSEQSKGYRCSFDLFRDGGNKSVFNERAPDKLACEASFVRSKDGGWMVKHLPPKKRVGHSRTTMACKSTT